ncbi:MAG: RnfABCDGE type electron transport complex subunit G [Lentimicrobiaceae bacterium]|nr:RnfABCDGE type electron transport complex subunit G [Lentimicrobiaceae bacterium]
MSKKLPSTLPNMVLSLVIITAVVAMALSFVYGVTQEPIQKTNREREVGAIKNVIPNFDNDPTLNPQTINDILIYVGMSGTDTVGYAIKTYTNMGYGGRFDLMVGFNPDCSINKIVVLGHNETPGLGSKMTEDGFMKQFSGLKIKELPNSNLGVKKDGGTIDAITASTVTTRAFCDGVQKAYNALQELLNKNV